MQKNHTRSIKYCILAIVVILLAFFVQNRFVEIGSSSYGMMERAIRI